MVTKLLNPLEDPTTASSSDDEEVDTSSGEDEEQISKSSEENNPKDPSTKTLKSPSTAIKQNSDSEPGSETDSDTEAQPPPKATAVKSKKKEVNDSPAVKSGKKRASEGTSTDVNAKKAKNLSGEDNKKGYFKRLWSEEDEIFLLQRMIDYKADTGKSPYDDMNGFFESVKKGISFKVSKAQFVDKIKSLKKKYIGKAKKGQDVSFTRPHENKCLELAKYIWGSDGLGLESAVKSPVQSKKEVDSMVESAVKSPVQSKKEVDSMVGSAVKSPKKTEKKVDSVVEEDKKMVGSDGIVHESCKSNGKVKNVEPLEPEGEKVEGDKEVLIHGGGSESSSWFENSFLVRSITSFGVEEQSLKHRWSMVPMETKKRIEEKLKLVQAKEFELLMLKTDILSDTSSVISEAI